MSPRKRGNFVFCSIWKTMKFRLRIDSNPGPPASQSDPLIHYTKFPYGNFLKNFKVKYLEIFTILSVAESPH